MSLSGDLDRRRLEQIRRIEAERDEALRKLSEAEAEIDCLRSGGCARDQRTTQYCAEAAELAKLLEEAEEAIRWYHGLGTPEQPEFPSAAEIPRYRFRSVAGEFFPAVRRAAEIAASSDPYK